MKSDESTTDGAADKRRLANFVNGAFVDPVDGTYTDAVNPSTGEVYATAPLSGTEDIDRAFLAAAEAFATTWRKTTPRDRMEALLKMADAIDTRAGKAVARSAADTVVCGPATS